MPTDERFSRADTIRPRHRLQEIADLLAQGLLRLRAANSATDLAINPGDKGEFRLAMNAHQSVHANPDQHKGVRA